MITNRGGFAVQILHGIPRERRWPAAAAIIGLCATLAFAASPHPTRRPTASRDVLDRTLERSALRDIAERSNWLGNDPGLMRLLGYLDQISSAEDWIAGVQAELAAVVGEVNEPAKLRRRLRDWLLEGIEGIIEFVKYGRRTHEGHAQSSIATLVARAAVRGVDHGIVLDPACRSGEYLAAVSLQDDGRPGAPHLPRFQLIGFEADDDERAIAAIRLRALAAEYRLAGQVYETEKASAVVFSSLDETWTRGFARQPSKTADTLRSGLERLPPGGRLVAHLSYGFLSRGGGDATLREMLVERCAAIAVIAVRAPPDPESTVLVLDKERSRYTRSAIRFIDACPGDVTTAASVEQALLLVEGGDAPGDAGLRAIDIARIDVLQRGAVLQPRVYLPDAHVLRLPAADTGRPPIMDIRDVAEAQAEFASAAMALREATAAASRGANPGSDGGA